MQILIEINILIWLENQLLIWKASEGEKKKLNIYKLI